MYYLCRTNKYAKELQGQVMLVSEKLPVTYVEIAYADIPKMIAQIDSLLMHFEAQLQRSKSKFQSASSLRAESLSERKNLGALQETYAQFEKQQTAENARLLYEKLIELLEFAAKNRPIHLKNGWMTLASSQVEDDDVQHFVSHCFDVTPHIRRGTITDEVGVSETGISFYFMATDVLYNFPTLLRKKDVPNVILDFSTYVQKKVTRGKTASMVVSHAMTRIIEGLDYRQTGLFAFCATPFATCELGDYALPLLFERHRLVVRSLRRVTLVERQQTRKEIEEMNISVKDLYKKVSETPWIVQHFSTVHSTKDDARHLPVPLTLLHDLPSFMETYYLQLPPDKLSFYRMLSRVFERKMK